MSERRPQEAGHVSAGQLRRAVTEGIITPDQHDRILSLAAEFDDGAGAAGAVPAAEPASAHPSLSPLEAPRGFNAVTVAYHLGALLVLFAGAGFLIDRWAALRPGGVLLVSLFYALVFAGAGTLLHRRGFRLAAGMAATLVVIMAPVMAWATASLAGVWAPWEILVPVGPPGDAPWDSGRWLIPQLATVAAALVAWLLTRHPLVIAPAGFALWSITVPITELLFGLELGGALVSRVSLVIGTLMIALGYLIDRRSWPERSRAFWIYLFGVIGTFVGLVHIASGHDVIRHLSPLVALAAIALSLRIGQMLFLAAGILGLVVYLAHLSFDVFAGTALYPIVLAALGVSIILATVWLQRAYPVLVRRSKGDSDIPPSVPGGILTMLLPAALALAFLIGTVPAQRSRVERQIEERQRLMEEMERIERERRRPDGLEPL